MAIDQVIKEALIRINLETKKAEKELKDFTKQTDATAKSLDNVSVQSLDVQKSLDTIGLGAERQVPRLEKLHSSFQGFTGKIGKGLNAIDSFGKALGPWNQALELGGKALDGVVAGLDAYAKTSPEAAREVQALKDEFGHLKDAALAAAGAMTVEMAKAIPVADELGRKWKEIEQTKFFKAFGFNTKGQVLGTDFLNFYGGDDSGSTFDTTKFDAFRDSIEINYISKLEEAKKKWDELQAAAKRAHDEDLRFIRDFREQQLNDRTRNNINTSGFSISDQFGAFGFSNKGGIDTSLLSQRGAIESAFDSQVSRDTADERYQQFRTRKKNALLERLGLGSPEEMSLALSAVQGLTSGIQTALQALGEGTLSGADAFKKGLGIMIHAVGDKLAALSAAEAIEGAAMLLTLNPAGALHLAASGLLGAGAVAAYAASAKLGGGGGSAPSVPSTSTGATGAVPASSPRYLPQPAPLGGGGPVVNQYIGYVDEDSPRLRQRRAERLVNLGTQHTSAGGSF